ncbi:uncharacterized protein A4U43_C10F14180 [Asparagus officinalis]|uniref:rRNA 2'-O-methyltransferase fibrillarin n=1 Tax=Asparagus officinalis TaxID=4686 RepID=A0A5P1E5W4_ASPOF|nr:uncharacterized protein A4U43_C10F14180 [Asparagus officinalis]
MRPPRGESPYPRSSNFGGKKSKQIRSMLKLIYEASEFIYLFLVPFSNSEQKKLEVCVLNVDLQNEDGTKVEYRVWNPFRSKLAAAILGGVDRIYIARIVALNASYFLKNGGHFVISIKANCIDSTASAEAVFAQEVKKLQAEQFKPEEQVTLEPFERDHACVVGGYRMPKKQKAPAA